MKMRTLQQVIRRERPPEQMRLGLLQFGVWPNGHAEVVGITSEGILGHNQRATLLITAPERKPLTAPLQNRLMVTKALEFCARYNVRAAQLAAAV